MKQIKIWFDTSKKMLFILQIESGKIKTIIKEAEIKRFLLAHGLKKEDLKGPVDTNDVTGVFRKKGKILDFLRRKSK